MHTKNKVIENIREFFSVDIQKEPEKLFNVLKKIVPFNYGKIYLSDKLVYSYGKKQSKYELIEDLKIKNAPFGEIKIYRDKDFLPEESQTFKTCTLIISNLLKDIEIAKIINMQLKALEEGILETNKAYKTEKNKNDIFANFSHDLRTPLNSIICSSELLAEEIFGKLNEKQAEYVSDIRISGIYLLGMINDILDMSKIESKAMKLNKTNFNIKSAFNEVCNIIKPIAEKKNIKITQDCEDLQLCADYQKFQQILFNLTTNAIKYTKDGGKIVLSAKISNDKTQISVTDNGIGIYKKYHKKIFNKFTQLNSAKNSNGLGLTITKELVKLHGGTINVNSEPGKGSCFSFTID